MSRYSTQLWLCIAVAAAAYHQPIVAATNSSEYSLITKEEMLALPKAERTVAAALRMCMERSSAREFCGWFFVEPSTELVLGGTCFDEIQYPCNRFTSAGRRGSRRKIRHLTCDRCSACSDHQSTCNGVNCTMMCYCSCGHGYNSDRGFTFDPRGSDWHFVYPCSGLCEDTLHCPFGEDEQELLCTTLNRLGKNLNDRSMSEYARTPDFYLYVLGGVIFLGYIIFYLTNLKYKWYPWLLPSINRHVAAAALREEQELQQLPHRSQAG